MPSILVADDNPVSLAFFADALARLGVDCVSANDGLEAVAQAARTRFDLLLFDANMPGLDGDAALARIRRSESVSHDTPALATTADASASVRAALLAAGFAEVIPKPIALEALRSALARHLTMLAPGAAPTDDAASVSFDEAQALAAAGGDAGIVSALRGLLAAELDALPAELASMAVSADFAKLRDRLHRLDASAGFCGAPVLSAAGAKLRRSLDVESGWPHAAAKDFLATCAAVRAALVRD